jgi:hypothetical protein
VREFQEFSEPFCMCIGLGGHLHVTSMLPGSFDLQIGDISRTYVVEV